MSLSDIQVFEHRTRVDHTSNEGHESHRTFYVEPYKCFIDVLQAMEGKVVQDPATGDWVRTSPAVDSYLPGVLAETRITPVDSDGVHLTLEMDWPAAKQKVIDEHGGKLPVPGQAEQHPGAVTEEDYATALKALTEGFEEFAAGALITGIYRPIVSSYVTDLTDPKAFDYLDVTVAPGSMTLPWLQGLRYAPGLITDSKHWAPLDEKIVSPIVIPTMEITIRRSLVGQLRAGIWNQFLGKVNDADWNTEFGMSFPAETVRFDSWEPVSRQNINGFYWDILLNFTSINYTGQTVQKTDGSWAATAPVTWNHVMKPISAWDTPIEFSAVLSGFAHTDDVAWYRPIRTQEAVAIFGLVPLRPEPAGWLYPVMTTTFDRLFDLNPDIP